MPLGGFAQRDKGASQSGHAGDFVIDVTLGKSPILLPALIKSQGICLCTRRGIDLSVRLEQQSGPTRSRSRAGLGVISTPCVSIWTGLECRWSVRWLCRLPRRWSSGVVGLLRSLCQHLISARQGALQARRRGPWG